MKENSTVERPAGTRTDWKIWPSACTATELPSTWACQPGIRSSRYTMVEGSLQFTSTAVTLKSCTEHRRWTAPNKLAGCGNSSMRVLASLKT